MPRPSIRWVISDTHFYHDAMVELCQRPVDFNERILKACRYVIAPQDLLIHLGDVIFYKYHTLKDLLDSIPCRKVLTLGNHDRRGSGWYSRNGFDFVCDAFTLDDILFSHKPMPFDPQQIRLNIHGHLHNTDHRAKPDWYTDRHHLISLEQTGYKPIDLCSIVNLYEKLTKPAG